MNAFRSSLASDMTMPLQRLLPKRAPTVPFDASFRAQTVPFDASFSPFRMHPALLHSCSYLLIIFRPSIVDLVHYMRDMGGKFGWYKPTNVAGRDAMIGWCTRGVDGGGWTVAAAS